MPKIINTHAAKHWCFTLNNPAIRYFSFSLIISFSLIFSLLKVCFPPFFSHETVSSTLSKVCSYFIFQLEEGEANTRHFQGYFILKKKTRLSGLRKSISGRAHFEIARGNPQQNRAYCSKEESRISGPYEFGELPSSKRQDLLSFQKSCSRSSNEELWRNHFGLMLRYHKSVDTFRLETSSSVRSRPICFILYGPAGVGKSSLPRSVYPEAFWKDVTSKWWDGYTNQSVVVFDDYYGGIQLSTLLRLIDYGSVQVEVKGGYRPLVAECFVFTSNSSPDKWYQSVKEDSREGWMRRLREFCLCYTRNSLHVPWTRIQF